ncbi:hypothetical protein, partial [Mycobacteroides abscessus]|uniref:hypothetical protein n=1 Tax=Mycobacteroides abscessus TaxID=36809 RepID=UPI001C71A533
LVTTPIPEVLTYFRSPRRSQPVWELQLAPGAPPLTASRAPLTARREHAQMCRFPAEIGTFEHARG